MTLQPDRILKPLIGLLLLCVFTMRPCAALVRDVSLLKNLAPLEKSVDEAAKECKDTKDGKNQLKADCRLPESPCSPAQPHSTERSKPRILHEVLGCPGPILQILTPPPDGWRS